MSFSRGGFLYCRIGPGEGRPGAFQSATLVQVIRLVHAAGMQVGLRHFDLQTLDWLADRLPSGEATRHGLAREL